MRRNELLIGEPNLPVLELTTGGSMQREQALLHEIIEQVAVRPVGDAQHVEETLAGEAVPIREVAYVDLAARRQGRPEMRGAGDGSARHVLAELQQDERRERISGILLAPEDRDFQNVEHGVRQFMQ